MDQNLARMMTGAPATDQSTLVAAMMNLLMPQSQLQQLQPRRVEAELAMELVCTYERLRLSLQYNRI